MRSYRSWMEKRRNTAHTTSSRGSDSWKVTEAPWLVARPYVQTITDYFPVNTAKVMEK
uniref:Uncharacterized protein n=1 Tax=Arion vulgaris TaxID=1028688 RepID=A0A0B7A9D4_9EUPU